MGHPSWPKGKKIGGALFKLFVEAAINDLDKQIIKVIKAKPNRGVYKAWLEGGGIIRIDHKQARSKEISRIQMLVHDSGVKVPKVFVSGGIKLSEWIDGVDLYFVKNLPEANIQLGELLGALNTVKENGRYAAQGDIGNTNFIWTKDKELYMIDFGSLRLTNYGDALRRTAAGVCKRVAKNRREWVYEGYAKYHNIDQFIKLVNECDKIFGKKYLIGS